MEAPVQSVSIDSKMHVMLLGYILFYIVPRINRLHGYSSDDDEIYCHIEMLHSYDMSVSALQRKE